MSQEDMDGPSLDLEDEWEVVNDEGFVYKRRKRNHVSSTPNPSKIIMNHDDEQYVKQRHKIKKSALLNLKEKYVEEIREWESLFHMLQRTPTSARPSMKETALCPPSLHQTQTENSCKHVLGELLQQAEAQEAILQDATTLCSFAERMCDVHKEDLKQPSFDLPVWGTPTTLLHNLCPSDSEDNG